MDLGNSKRGTGKTIISILMNVMALIFLLNIAVKT